MLRNVGFKGAVLFVALALLVAACSDPATNRPDPFSFPSVTDAVPGDTVRSAEVTITGLTDPVPATVTTGGTLIIDGTPSGAAAEVHNNARLAVEVVASSEYEESVTVTVNVGGFEADFTVTTMEEPDVATVCESPDEVITFADTELEGYFRELPGIPDTGDLTCAHAQSVTVFRTPTWQDKPGTASSLAGMQHLVNLETFWAEFNDFEDLTPLAGLTNLQVLQLDGNRVTDLSPIAGLTELRLLGLWDNGPVRIDYEAGMDPATMCRDGISDISPLAGLVNLEVLYLSCNSVTDLTPLAGMESLHLAFLISNEITSIEPLEGLTNLQALRFSDNQVSSVDGVLETLTGLRWLEMAYNQLEDESLAALGVLPDLFAIDLEGNYFTNMDPILANASLPGAEGVEGLAESDAVQQPDVPTVSLGYNCMLPEETVLATVEADLEAQGFEVVGGFGEEGAMQRPAEDCEELGPEGIRASSSAPERQLQLFRDRIGLR